MCALARFFSRALFFANSLLPYLFPPLFSSILTKLLALFLFSFLSNTPSGLKPLTFRILLAYQSFFYTTTPQDSVEVYPPKLIFILLDSLACTKISITIYCMLHTCCTLHENIHRICGFLKNKRWWR